MIGSDPMAVSPQVIGSFVCPTDDGSGFGPVHDEALNRTATLETTISPPRFDNRLRLILVLDGRASSESP